MQAISKSIVLAISLMFYVLLHALASEAKECASHHSAAGVLPYAELNGKVHLLLGHEPGQRYWTDFVGGRKDIDCNAVDTAAREFAEESRLAYPASETLPKLQHGGPEKVGGGHIHIWIIKVKAIDADEIAAYHPVKDSEKDTYCWMPLDGVLRVIDNGNEFRHSHL